MIISRNLIAKFLPEIKNYSIEEVSNALFKSGIEIERYEEIHPPKGLFYGRIKSFEKIKGSDKLNLCQVEIPFKQQTFDIVCGASNVKKNLNVVVALPGAEIFNGTITIQKREVFKVLSNGMICSYSELYESKLLDKSRDNVQGIIELDKDFDINKDFSLEDLGLDDVVFDLSIPVNRPDLNCAWGLAQELCKNLKIKTLPIDVGTDAFSNENHWDLKKLLLTNNFVCGDFLSNLGAYVYIAFNESIDEALSFPIKKKSSYFSKLASDFLDNLGVYIEERLKPKIQNSFSSAVNLDWDEIDGLLHISCENKRQILNLLSKYGFGFSPDYSVVFPPAWRLDVNNSRSFLEELLKFWGMDDISEEIPTSEVVVEDNEAAFSRLAIREFLISRNFLECTTFNLHKENPEELCVSNPASKDHVSLRRNALQELIQVIESNYKKKNKSFPVFEIVELPEEGWTLNIVVPERSTFFALNKTTVKNDLYDLQALIFRAFSYLNQKVEISLSKGSRDCFMDVNLLDISKDKYLLGHLGFLKSNHPVKLWGCVVKLPWSSKREFISPKVFEYPPSFKDISVEIGDSNLGIGDVIRSLRGNNLRSVELIEKYEKDNLISYLLRCKFQSFSKTLEAAEIEESMNSIYDQLRSMNVNIR